MAEWAAPGDSTVVNVYITVYSLTMVKAVKKRYSFFITEDLAAGLKALKERDGTPEGETLRRALAEWLKRKRIRRVAKT